LTVGCLDGAETPAVYALQWKILGAWVAVLLTSIPAGNRMEIWEYSRFVRNSEHSHHKKAQINRK
jgi:N-acyl-L-homoserine lactone synthetase